MNSNMSSSMPCLWLSFSPVFTICCCFQHSHLHFPIAQNISNHFKPAARISSQTSFPFSRRAAHCVSWRALTSPRPLNALIKQKESPAIYCQIESQLTIRTGIRLRDGRIALVRTVLPSSLASAAFETNLAICSAPYALNFELDSELKSNLVKFK